LPIVDVITAPLPVGLMQARYYIDLQLKHM